MQPNNIDPTVRRLVSAIAQTETGAASPEAYTKRGASGEYGRYQFMPDTWAKIAPQAGVNVPLEQASIEDQNKVAYSKIKAWKDQGYNPAQIASMWNAGEGRPNAYRENWRGVNSQGVAYDTPAYAQKVSALYQGSQAPMNYQTSVDLPDEKPKPGEVSYETEPTLGDAIGRRTDQIDTAVQKTLSGEQGVFSGALQGAGALAGGLLDIGGAAIKSIPVVGDAVELAEDALGAGAQAIFDTEVGRSALQGYQGWAEEHPEAAANIGAAANIASVIPIFKGVAGAMKGAVNAKDALFADNLKKTAKEEMEMAVNRTATGMRKMNNAKGRGFDPFQVIIDDDAIPDVIDDGTGVMRYSTGAAEQKLDDLIERLDGKLDAELAGATGTDLGGYVPMNSLKDDVIKEVEKELKGSPDMQKYLNRIEDDFDSFKLSYGDILTLNEVNAIKRMVRKSVKFDTPDIDKNLRYHEGQVFMKVIEEVAKKRGLGNIRQLNRQMAERIEAEELLRRISNKSVIPERSRGANPFVENAAVSGGEAVGQSFGTPLVGGMVGKGVAGLIGRKKKTAVEKLNGSKQRKNTKGTQQRGLVAASLQGAERGSRETRAQESTLAKT